MTGVGVRERVKRRVGDARGAEGHGPHAGLLQSGDGAVARDSV